MSWVVLEKLIFPFSFSRGRAVTGKCTDLFRYIQRGYLHNWTKFNTKNFRAVYVKIANFYFWVNLNSSSVSLSPRSVGTVLWLPMYILNMHKIRVGSETLTAVLIIFAVFWDIASCSPHVNRRSGGTVMSNFRVENQKSTTFCYSLASRTADFRPWRWTSVYIRTTRRYIPEDSNFRIKSVQGSTYTNIQKSM
jgi:hypothetical protein